jgi:hypothetical protein
VLASAPVGRPVEVVVARDGRLLTAPLTPAPPRVQAWRLEVNPQAGPEAAERRRRWLALEVP